MATDKNLETMDQIQINLMKRMKDKDLIKYIEKKKRRSKQIKGFR